MRSSFDSSGVIFVSGGTKVYLAAFCKPVVLVTRCPCLSFAPIAGGLSILPTCLCIYFFMIIFLKLVLPLIVILGGSGLLTVKSPEMCSLSCSMRSQCSVVIIGRFARWPKAFSFSSNLTFRSTMVHLF